MKIALIILGLLVIAVAGVVLYALTTQPDTFRISRTATINAPADKIFGIVTDLRRGVEWSPYEKKDLAMKKTFSGPASGPGARLAWDGNKDVGAGTLTVADVTPSKVTLDLDMTRPMKASNTVEYSFAPQGRSTTMTWARWAAPLISGRCSGSLKS